MGMASIDDIFNAWSTLLTASRINFFCVSVKGSSLVWLMRWESSQIWKFQNKYLCVSKILKLWILHSINCIIIDFLKRNMKNPESPNLIWFSHLIVEFFALRWNWPSAFRRTHWSRCWSDSKSKKSNILKRFHSKLSIRFSKWTTRILASLDLIQSV